MRTAVMSEEYDQRGDVDEVFGHDDCCAHEDFEILLFHASRRVERKPGEVEQRSTSIVSRASPSR